MRSERVLDVYATAPPPVNGQAANGAPLACAARWAEAADLSGLLIFTDNSAVDPWLAAQYLLERSERLVPLVAVQPVYMHPFTAARMVCTLSALYGRRIDLNLVAGGYTPDQRALGALLPHDERYERLVEYGRVMAELLEPGRKVTHRGKHYTQGPTVLQPALPEGLRPRVFLAGASPACAWAVRELGCEQLTYPRAIEEYREQPDALDGVGIRIGVIARESSGQAWEVARRRFPPQPRNEAVNLLSMQSVDAQWQNRIWDDSERRHAVEDVYWLHPFRVSQEFCPFLVGDYDEVAERLAQYLGLGVGTLILSAPHDEDDIHHAMTAVRRAERLAGARAG
ncbi:LLM class flavin-dependent oxidoreductase [Streptomyces sp. NPDC006435]|uniref:LLM class flavin-dependent oxidoreductase n=1 Tax=Streptomyces sp. NPDC006435 TaxID=3154300 RepID=UPI0033A4559F